MAKLLFFKNGSIGRKVLSLKDKSDLPYVKLDVGKSSKVKDLIKWRLKFKKLRFLTSKNFSQDKFVI